jgi:hypothetical protein
VRPLVRYASDPINTPPGLSVAQTTLPQRGKMQTPPGLSVAQTISTQKEESSCVRELLFVATDKLVFERVCKAGGIEDHLFA